MYQTDDDLIELLLIPRVGRARARALFNAGFRTLEDLAKATPEQLAKIPGISRGIAAGIIESAAGMIAAQPAEEKLESKSRIDICPMCGSMVSAGARVCNVCGVTFSEEEEDLTLPEPGHKTGEEDGYWYRDQGKLFICPECGSLVADGSNTCPKCGVRFEEGEEGPEPPKPAAGDADGYWYKDRAKLSMCPNCGAFLGADAESCPTCGLAFEAGEEEPEPERPVCPMCNKEIPPGENTCGNCGFDFSAEKDRDGYWYKEQGGLFMCPNCGAFIPKDADRCGICNTVLEEAEEEPGPKTVLCPVCAKPVPEGAARCAGCGFALAGEGGPEPVEEPVALYICPMCGAFMSESASKCANCGAAFDEEGEHKTVTEPDLTARVPARVAAEKEAEDIIELAEMEEELESAALREVKAKKDELVLCPVCGAFAGSGETKCPACGAVFDDIEEMDLESAKKAVKSVEGNLKLAREMAAEIEEIEAELLEPPEPKRPERKGVSKDFLDRWKKLDERPGGGRAEPKAAEEDLEKELGAIAQGVWGEPEALDDADLMAGIDELAAKSKPAGFWSRRAKELAAEGRVEEAVACLDRAAEEDPDRELEYKRLMLEIMGVGITEQKLDLSEIAAIDDIGELNIDKELLSGRAEARLAEIERALEAEPGNSALWQEKGEILEKLGRHEEAVQCFDTSISMTYADLRKEAGPTKRVPQIGIGLTNGQGRVNGRVNGLLTQRRLFSGGTDGLTDGTGKVNGLRAPKGRINGMVNGLAGRVNGLTNGAGLVNGRTDGRVNGRINGNGMINGSRAGIVNGGLVNGLGLVNGEAIAQGAGALRRLRQRRRERIVWRYRLTAMALFVTMVLMLSMMGNIMIEEETGAIRIDGEFSDWADIGAYTNFLGTGTQVPNLRMLETYMALEGDSLKARVVFGAQPFDALPDSVDSVWFFVELDSDPGTGYIMDGRGMDLMAEIYGWNRTIMGSGLYRFDNMLNRSDWNGFYSIGSPQCEAGDSGLEAALRIPRDMAQLVRDPSMLVIATDTLGNMDMTDYFMSRDEAGCSAAFSHSDDDVITPGASAILGTLTVSAHGPRDSELLSLEFRISGAIPADRASISLADQAGADIQTQTAVSGDVLTLELMPPLELARGASAALTVRADIPQDASGTLGLLLGAANASGPARVRNLNTRAHNIGIPDYMAADGAFGDWTYVQAGDDRLGDVAPAGNSALVNNNVDIRGSALVGDGSDALYFFASVDGIMMGGADLPSIRHRPGPAPVEPEADTDRDTVPDGLDPHPLDFNNDGIPDVQSVTSGNLADHDGDGQADYPNGQDWWLNTTIPSGVAAPYGGASVSVYIGPVNVTHRENLGDDRAYIMFDADNDSQTGGNLRGAPGIEYAVVVSGKQNGIMASELYISDPSAQPTGWRFLRNVPAATDWTRLEGAVAYSWLGLSPGDSLTMSVAFEDWAGSSDISDGALTPQELVYSLAGTRSPAGDNVVINEIVSAPNNAEWIELCNPTNAPINIGGWRLRRGNNNLVVFPAGTVLGAFGSGTEYYVATFFGGRDELPNGGGTVNLQWDSPGPGWTTVDSATYIAMLPGQSFARYKNATWGMPADTDGTGDWYTSAAPSQGGPNDRTRPVVAVAKSGSAPYGLPGDSITFTVWYNNTGDGNARHVWVNDTLPSGMTYQSSSQAYDSYSGQTYRWHLLQAAPGAHSFTVTAIIDAGVPTGTVLTNSVQLQYTDQLSRFMGTSSDSWIVMVQAPPPVMQLAKSAAVSNPSPGDPVEFVIQYDNVGGGTASHVWLNDTLPAGMTYVMAWPAPETVSGQNIFWHFTGLAPGVYQVRLNAQIGSGVGYGTVLTNSVVCDYKDSSGLSRPQESAQASVTVTDPINRIIINEISIRENDNEWVEVCNPSNSSVNIGGWRIRAGRTTVYTFPAGTTLGPWGSGTEYFVADTGGGNDFGNNGGTVRLQRRAGWFWTTVDQTTYPGGITSAQTWSRFKHEDSGKPIDTGAAADWYVSNNAWLVPEGPTPGEPNDRKRPVMVVEKSVSPLTAEPGQLVIYTIWYNNTGDGNAKAVWVNDTLPAGMDYVSATPTPASVSGQDIVWYFNNVVHGTVNSITLTARMNSLPADGEVLTNLVALVYHDQLKRPMGSSMDWANVTCSRANVSVLKVSDVAETVAGGTVVYTIYYNNTGSANAGSVWINDTLPVDVTFVSASVAPTVAGLVLSWHLTDVAPGAHSITVTVTVNSTAGSGTITNWAFLDYASNYGAALGPSSDSASVIIPEMHTLILPMLGILMIFGMRRRGKNGKYK